MVEEHVQVKLLMAGSALLAVLLLVAPSADAPSRAAAADTVAVKILFDFADGSYVWFETNIANPAAHNSTWNATLTVARSFFLDISWVWYSFGASGSVFVTDVGNRSPPGGVGIYVWNATNHAWIPSSVGISDLVLRNGDSLALYDAGFAPVTFAQQYPAPTPDNPWPVLEFRGDSANSGQAAAPVYAFLPVPKVLGGTLLWDRDLHLSEIEASPIVARGRVFILTLDGLFALSEANGTVLWSNTSIKGLSTPAYFDGTLILGGSDGKVHCVNATSGAELWATTLISPPGPSGITSSPKVDFDTVYVGTFNESGGPGEVVALWATNGTVLWRHVAPGSISFSSPAVDQGRLFVGVIGRYNTTTTVTYDPPYGVLALNATDGTQLWFRATGGPVAASLPVMFNRVYAPSKDGRLYCLLASNGTVEWDRDVGAGVSSPAVSGFALFVGGGTFGGTGRVSKLDSTDGTVLWSVPTNGPVQSSVTTSGTGQILFSTNAQSGAIYALDQGTGQVVWSFTPSPAQYIFSSPVVADDKVFAASDNGHVYAFGPSSSWLDLSAAGPSSLSGPSPGPVNLTLRAARGAVADITVWLNLSGLSVITASPNGTIEPGLSGDHVIWQLDKIPFNGTVNLSVRVRAICDLGNAPCDGSGYRQTVKVAYGDFYGLDAPYSANATLTIVLLSGGATSPGTVPFWIPVLVVLSVLVAAVVVALIVRRRPRLGP